MVRAVLFATLRLSLHIVWHVVILQVEWFATEQETLARYLEVLS